MSGRGGAPVGGAARSRHAAPGVGAAWQGTFRQEAVQQEAVRQGAAVLSRP